MTGDIEYCNDGDWVENGTVLVEHPDDCLEIVDRSHDMASIQKHINRAGQRA